MRKTSPEHSGGLSSLLAAILSRALRGHWAGIISGREGHQQLLLEAKQPLRPEWACSAVILGNPESLTNHPVLLLLLFGFSRFCFVFCLLWCFVGRGVVHLHFLRFSSLGRLLLWLFNEAVTSYFLGRRSATCKCETMRRFAFAGVQTAFIHLNGFHL